MAQRSRDGDGVASPPAATSPSGCPESRAVRLSEDDPRRWDGGFSIRLTGWGRSRLGGLGLVVAGRVEMTAAAERRPPRYQGR
jgi:hypothetical protein